MARVCNLYWERVRSIKTVLFLIIASASLSGETVPTDLWGKRTYKYKPQRDLFLLTDTDSSYRSLPFAFIGDKRDILQQKFEKQNKRPSPFLPIIFSSTWHKVNEIIIIIQRVLIRALTLFQDPEARYFGIPVPFLSDLFVIVESFDPWQPVASWAPQCDHWVFFLPPSCMRNK